MATSLAFLLFGTLLVAGIFRAAKIQRQELLEARAKRAKADEERERRHARLEEFRAKCYRPDGD